MQCAWCKNEAKSGWIYGGVWAQCDNCRATYGRDTLAALDARKLMGEFEPYNEPDTFKPLKAPRVERNDEAQSPV